MYFPSTSSPPQFPCITISRSSPPSNHTLHHSFILHGISKCFLTEQNLFPVKVRIHHRYDRIIFFHIPDYDRHLCIPKFFCTVFSAMPGDDPIKSFRCWHYDQRIHNSVSLNAFHEPCYCFERMILEWPQTLQTNLYNLLDSRIE